MFGSPNFQREILFLKRTSLRSSILYYEVIIIFLNNYFFQNIYEILIIIHCALATSCHGVERNMHDVKHILTHLTLSIEIEELPDGYRV